MTILKKKFGQLLRTNVDGNILTEGVKISNRGRKLVGNDYAGHNMFNHFTTAMPANYDTNTRPEYVNFKYRKLDNSSSIT